MNRPNLFQFATSELSQDAFICWLLSWANEKYKGSAPELHQCATETIAAMFDKYGKKPPAKINEVEVRQQDKKIDVLCILDEKYAILIEDKTDTSHHSGQLGCYLREVKSREYDEENVIPIYYKTGDQTDYEKVHEANYKEFLRGDILEILGRYTGDNPILLDYREHVQCIEDAVNEYATKPVNDWGNGSRAWVGFFKELQKRLGEGEWSYVPNARGGFMCFKWHDKGDSVKGTPYLLLEEKKLCFKIYVGDKSERAVRRDYWYHALIEEKGKFELLSGLEKPKRFGAGANMTVCIDEDYRFLGSKGLIDIGKTVETLKAAQDLLDLVRGKHRSGRTD